MLAIVIIVILGIFYSGLVQEGPTYPKDENGIVEISYSYCSQFSEETCDEQMVPLDYNTGIEGYYPEPVRCYWNIDTSECFANIGYQ